MYHSVFPYSVMLFILKTEWRQYHVPFFHSVNWTGNPQILLIKLETPKFSHVNLHVFYLLPNIFEVIKSIKEYEDQVMNNNENYLSEPVVKVFREMLKVK